MAPKDVLSPALALTHESQREWFHRMELLLRARQLGATVMSAGEAAEALQVVAANLTGDQLTLYCPVGSAPNIVWSRLKSVYASKTGMAQASLLLKLAALHPSANETLDVFLSRSQNLRSELISAECLADTAITCMWLGMLRERVPLLADWAVQNLQRAPLPTLPDLVNNLQLAFMGSLQNVIECVEPSAHAVAALNRNISGTTRTAGHTPEQCTYCGKHPNGLLACRK